MSNVGPYPADIILANIKILRDKRYDIGIGHCLEAMRKVAGVDALYPTATIAGNHTHIHEVKGVNDIPPGVFIYWGERDGHIGFSLGMRNGVHRCFTPGSPAHPNLWRNIPTRNITLKWGHVLRGWSKEIDGVTI